MDGKLIGEFARRVLDGEKTADLFGVDDHFISEVIDKAYKFYSSKSYEQAEVLLRGATALDETQAYPHLLLGEVLLQQSKFVGAVEELERARDIDGDSAETLAKLGEAQMRAGQRQTGRANLKAAMAELDEQSPHYKRAAALLEAAIGASSEGEHATSEEPA